SIRRFIGIVTPRPLPVPLEIPLSCEFLNSSLRNRPKTAQFQTVPIAHAGNTLAADSAHEDQMREQHSTPNEYTPDGDLDGALIPPWPALSDLAFETDATDGVQIDSLSPGTKVRVQTQNSEYWITVLEGGHRRVLVQGGILPTVSEARLE